MSRLADLHRIVTEALIDGCTEQEVQTADGVQTVKPSAAILAVALTHLKNNSITADPETNERMSALKQRLAERRATSKSDFKQLAQDADDFGATLQ